MSHANAALTPRARARLGRFVVVEGHTVSQAAKRFEVSYRTAKRWADRYREHGEDRCFAA
ncbi:MAG TPA: helix-turn-helix domain-containing protein, partial [Kineosporiaceae bacterium]|nr:helix-turn-helix domain-containing protein [Kineosporiaceae bacterium]